MAIWVMSESIEAEWGTLLDALDGHNRFGCHYRLSESYCRLAPTSMGEEWQRHITAAREAWTSIDRPDHVAELDAEFDGRTGSSWANPNPGWAREG